MKIIAIGGGEIGRPKEEGGFYPVETTKIDKRILELTNKKNPNLLFIPTASNDSREYFEVAKKHFESIGFSKINVLFLDKVRSKSELEKRVFSADAIYVGGGNTLKMMSKWRKLGIDTILKSVAKRDVVLSGISAGSICWFSFGSSDSRRLSSSTSQLIKVRGVGLIDALNCPHFNTEPFRKNDLKRMLNKTSRLVAIALDDCAALEVVGNDYSIISAKEGAKAYKAYWKSGKYHIRKLPKSGKLKQLLSKG